MLVFDFEVFQFDWLVVFKDITASEYHVIVNDRQELERFYKANKGRLHAGFNNKRYDNLVYRATLDGADPYTVNEMIITYENPLAVYRTWNLNKWWFPSIDVGQDSFRGSLKEFEGYLGLDIDETTIPFNINRKLTDIEIQEVITYCKSDVDATEKVLLASKDSIESKMAIVNEFGLTARELDNTNAQLVAKVLGAEKKDYFDEFEPFPFENHKLQLPDEMGVVKNGNREVRKSNIFDFYNRAPNYSEKLHIELAGVKHILAYGGLHGAIPNYKYEGEMWLLDAKQYYPNIMIQFGYLSRAVLNPKLYEDIVDGRDEMRNKGELLKAEAFKLISNTTFGASKAKFNQMYDPRMANNICISGQLMLVDLITRLGNSIKLLQSNTDGILVIPLNKEHIREEVAAWEKRHNLTMDIEIFDKLYQKDVNNYIAKNKDGELTVKGGYVSQTTINGHKPFGLRRTSKIVDDAVVNYFIHGVLPEHTVGLCGDKLDFQIIRKTGRTFDGTVWLVNGERVQANWVNRVYAVKDKSMGKLYKVRDDGTMSTVPSLPDNCYLANKDDFDMNKLDREYYIKEAWSRIRDYEGAR